MPSKINNKRMFEFDIFSRKSIFVFHLMKDEDGFLLGLKNNLVQVDIISVPLDTRGHTLLSKFIFHHNGLIGYIYEFAFHDANIEVSEDEIKHFLTESTQLFWGSYDCICSIAYLNEWLEFDRGISPEFCYASKSILDNELVFALTKEKRKTNAWKERIGQIEGLIRTSIAE